jgi:hypothetical protein
MNFLKKLNMAATIFFLEPLFWIFPKTFPQNMSILHTYKIQKRGRKNIENNQNYNKKPISNRHLGSTPGWYDQT